MPAKQGGPSLSIMNGGHLILADLREFVEMAALHPGNVKVRVKLVPFKEVTHPDGQPIKSITIEPAP